jgi:PPOX class probable F420-dependent enzyme
MQDRISELLAARLIAVLATIDPDGAPYLTPVWFLDDGGVVLVATSGRSRKARNAAARPRASLLLHGRAEKPLYHAFALGSVEVVRGDAARGMNERVWEKYLSAAGRRHPGVGEAIAQSDDVTLRFTPAAWRSWGTDVDFGGLYELPGLVLPLDSGEG